MVMPYTPRMIGTRVILKTRVSEKYEVEHSFCEGRYDIQDMWFVNVFRIRRDGTKRWLQTQSREYVTKKSGKSRYRKMIIQYIIGADVWNQFVDEVKGILKGNTQTQERQRSSLAKDQAFDIVASFFELEADDILAARKECDLQESVK